MLSTRRRRTASQRDRATPLTPRIRNCSITISLLIAESLKVLLLFKVCSSTRRDAVCAGSDSSSAGKKREKNRGADPSETRQSLSANFARGFHTARCRPPNMAAPCPSPPLTLPLAWSQAPVVVTTSHQCCGSCTGCQFVSESRLRSRGSCISRSLVLLPRILLTTVIFSLMLVVAR